MKEFLVYALSVVIAIVVIPVAMSLLLCIGFLAAKVSVLALQFIGA